MAETTEQAVPLQPIDPTNCPTCFSGIQPVEPPYTIAIDGEY